MKYWTLWMIAGVVAIIGGILALLNPFAASIAAVFLTGWTFLLTGALQTVGVLVEGERGRRLWPLLIGVLGVGLGLWILSRPLPALMALTLVIGWMFLFLGFLKVILAWPMREGPFFWPLILSGFLSAMLGMWILGGAWKLSEYLLGVLLAVELLANGVAAITLAMALRRAG